MKTLITTILLTIIYRVSYGQQDFGFNYNFKPILDSGKIQLYKIPKGANVGILRTVGNLIKLKGTVTKMSDNRDTLFIRLWPNSISPDPNHPQYLNKKTITMISSLPFR